MARQCKDMSTRFHVSVCHTGDFAVSDWKGGKLHRDKDSTYQNEIWLPGDARTAGPGGTKGPRAAPALAGLWQWEGDGVRCCSLKEELVAAELLSAELQSE